MTMPLAEQDRSLTLAEIDQRIHALWDAVADYRAGHKPAISPIDALELIDELLDLRYWHTKQAAA